jgi:aconitate decarboxylase
VGAAVAVGKLLGLDVPQLQRAISIAFVQVTGMHESFGTDTKPFHVGRAAQNGLTAAVLSTTRVQRLAQRSRSSERLG